MTKPILSIVVPAYNEQEVLPLTIKTLAELVTDMISQGLISDNSYICIVDDGSRDNTWNIIKQSAEGNKHIKGLKFSNNFGHQYALWAGMEYSAQDADCVVSIDADLQDDEQVIRDMVKYYLQGYEVVYGVRQDRKTDTFLKRFTAEQYYRLMKLMGVDLVFNHADFRLLGKKALKSLLQFEERNLFLRGLVPVLGFKNQKVFYKRRKRQAGESKYSLGKMFGFAWEGITSFSVKPLKLIAFTGMLFVVLSLAGLVVLLIAGQPVAVNFLILALFFLSGVQLLAIGVVGEYIGKIYKEVKRRPRYIIDQIVG